LYLAEEFEICWVWKNYIYIKKIYYAANFATCRAFSPETADCAPTSHSYSPVMANNGFYLVGDVSTNWAVTLLLKKLQINVEIKQ